MGGEYVDEVNGERAGHVDAVADQPPCLEPSGYGVDPEDPSEYLQGYWKGYEEGQSVRRKILKAVPKNETTSHIAAYIEIYECFTSLAACKWEEPDRFLEHPERWGDKSIPKDVAAKINASLEIGRLQAAINRLQDHYLMQCSAIGYLQAKEFNNQLRDIRYQKRESSQPIDTTEVKSMLHQQVMEWLSLYRT